MRAPSRVRLTILGALALAAALAACDKGQGAGAAKTDDALVAAWRKAGLEVSALTTVDGAPFSATSCKGGTVSGVDVVVCSYDSGEDAHAAEDLGLATIADATGSSLAHGSRLLVVADRRKKDPSGRTIDTIIRAFRS